MDARFTPQVKRQRLDEWSPEMINALRNYRPETAGYRPRASSGSSDNSWENIGGRVEGTNNVLLSWDGKHEQEEFGTEQQIKTQTEIEGLKPGDTGYLKPEKQQAYFKITPTETYFDPVKKRYSTAIEKDNLNVSNYEIQKYMSLPY